MKVYNFLTRKTNLLHFLHFSEKLIQIEIHLSNSTKIPLIYINKLKTNPIYSKIRNPPTLKQRQNL